MRGAKVMIARIPFNFSILLLYFPPGANDPNDPNYDPEAPEDFIRIWGAHLMNLSSAFHSAVWSPRDNSQVDVSIDSPATFSGVDIYLRRLSDNQDFYLGEIGASGTGRNRFSETFDLGESQSFSDLLDLSNPEAPSEQSFDLYAAAFLGSSANKVTTSSRKAGEGKAKKYGYLRSHWGSWAHTREQADSNKKLGRKPDKWCNLNKKDLNSPPPENPGAGVPRENYYNDKIGEYADEKGVDPVLLKALLASESGLTSNANGDSFKGIGQMSKASFNEGLDRPADDDRYDQEWDDPDKGIEAAAGYLKKNRDWVSNHASTNNQEVDDETKDKLAVVSYHYGCGDTWKLMNEAAADDDKIEWHEIRDVLEERKKDGVQKAKHVLSQTAKIFGGEEPEEDDKLTDAAISYDEDEAEWEIEDNQIEEEEVESAG